MRTTLCLRVRDINANDSLNNKLQKIKKVTGFQTVSCSLPVLVIRVVCLFLDAVFWQDSLTAFVL